MKERESRMLNSKNNHQSNVALGSIPVWLTAENKKQTN